MTALIVMCCYLPPTQQSSSLVRDLEKTYDIASRIIDPIGIFLEIRCHRDETLNLITQVNQVAGSDIKEKIDNITI